MVPPPGNTGDEFPDFDKMTFEEQMAWLESLAKRQGARQEELTTAADVDIPVPEDAQIDEPGYVPFEGSRSAREIKEGKQPSPVQPAQTPVEEPSFSELAAEEPIFEAAAEEFQAAEWESAVEISGDPMQWLDSLSAQSGEEGGDLTGLFGASDEEQAGEFATLDDFFADLGQGELESAPEEITFESELLEAEAEPEAAPPATEQSMDDLLGGMDPMRWLESLAARQGAKQEEFTTAADLKVDIPEDAVVDEPGYVPFEGSRSAREANKPVSSPPPPPPQEPEPVVYEELAPTESAEAESGELGLAWQDASEAELEFLSEPVEEFELPAPTELAAGADDLSSLLGGADPMTWLESLAKKGGVKDEELLTAADLDIPEVPEGTVIDEPGYVPFSALEVRPSASPEAAESGRARVELPPSMPEPEPVEEFEEFSAESELGALDESLSWLSDLSAPTDDLSEYLAVDDDMPEPVMEQFEPEPEAFELPALAQSADPLDGMSDEDVAYAQAHGQLTGEQELAWLKRQAAKLAEARQAADELEQEFPEEALPADELPPWLQQMRPGDEQALADLNQEFGLLAEPADVSDWLAPPSADDELSMSAELSLGSDVESLWSETAEPEPLALESDLIPDSELAAFLRGDIVPEEPDLLAEALDAEYDRQVVGDDSEPSWYTEAVAKAAAEAPPIQDADLEAPSAGESPAVEPVIAAPESMDMPAWMMDGEEAALAPASDVNMPDWLRETSGELAAAIDSAESPAWFDESASELPPAVPADGMPDWLQDYEPPVEQPAQEAKAAPAPEPPVAERPKVSPPPEPAQAKAPPPPPAEKLPPAPAVKAELPASDEPMLSNELTEQYQRQLEKDPNDHANRLAFARTLHSGRALLRSLDQYEMLIDSSQLLQDVAGDLDAIVREFPGVPRARRLLGDAYMRHGMLQEALDAYRSALDQL
ncbi:MAG: hypothetical protein HY866_05285 [Chloroflexi bacterium]|nr:hypothetical protein [Chloroflexota bacterium]